MLKFIHQIREEYSDSISKTVKSYFNLVKKIEKCNAGISFIKRCLENEKLPNFSRINLANNELSNNKQFANKIRMSVTEEELRNKNRRRRKLSKELAALQNQLFDLKPESWETLQTFVNEKTKAVQRELSEVHTSKLSRLGIQPKVNEKFVNKNRRGMKEKEEVNCADCIFNLSKRVLTDIEKRVLSKGLRYGIKSTRIDTFEILARVEEFAQSVNHLEIADTSDELKANLNSKTSFFRQLQLMTDEFLELSKEAYDSLSNEEHETLKVLAKDKSIVITKADKGNAVVIQNVEDYRRKIGDLLQTTGKFEKLTGDPTLKREFELQKELRKLNAKKGEKGIERKSRIDDKTYRKILPCGSRAGVMYGLGKVHKSGTPLRPIISAIGTYNYNLAKYLESILKPLVNKEFILTDTYDFVNKISKLDVVIDRYLVSFDVESLFTNVQTYQHWKPSNLYWI